MAFNDGIVSFATGLNSRAEQRTFIGGRKISDKMLSDLYSDNWIVRKFIDVRTTDMTRLDREILTDIEPEELERLESAARRTNAFKTREEALSWCSLYGDAMIVAITSFKSGDTPDDYMQTPLDLEFESIDRFIALDKTAYDFDVKDRDADITSANFGKPRMYRVRVGGDEILIHNSRVCRIEAGKRSFKDKVSQANKYGRSDIQAMKEPLFNYLSVAANISDIVEQSKTDVLYIDGFNHAIAAGREGEFTTLAVAMNNIRGSTGALMLDATARWEQKELTFTGLTDILKNIRDDVAGSCDMPLTRLFGQSAAGFASGAEDNQKYYESIASLQESRLRPLDEFQDKFLLADINASVQMLDFVYPSIELSNDTEKSAILSTTVTALTTLVQNGIIDEVQAAKELKNSDLMTSITDESIEELEGYIRESETENQAAQTSGSPTIEASGSVLPQTA